MKSTLLITLTLSLLTGCASQPQSTQSSRMDFALLSRDGGVRTDTPAFQVNDFRGDSKFREQHRHAVAGDREAMVRVAQMYSRGANGVPRNEQLMLKWLRHASELNHAGASYQLYLYYVGQSLDREAVRYENLAVRQGYTIPPRLDPRRG